MWDTNHNRRWETLIKYILATPGRGRQILTSGGKCNRGTKNHKSKSSNEYSVTATRYWSQNQGHNIKVLVTETTNNKATLIFNKERCYASGIDRQLLCEVIELVTRPMSQRQNSKAIEKNRQGTEEYLFLYLDIYRYICHNTKPSWYLLIIKSI